MPCLFVGNRLGGWFYKSVGELTSSGEEVNNNSIFLAYVCCMIKLKSSLFNWFSLLSNA